MRSLKTSLRFLVVSGFLCMVAFCPFDAVRAQQSASAAPVTAPEAYEIGSLLGSRGPRCYAIMWVQVSGNATYRDLRRFRTGLANGPLSRNLVAAVWSQIPCIQRSQLDVLIVEFGLKENSSLFRATAIKRRPGRFDEDFRDAAKVDHRRRLFARCGACWCGLA
jgi:hypothetical protein